MCSSDLLEPGLQLVDALPGVCGNEHHVVELETRLELFLNSLDETGVFAVPFDRGDVVSRIHDLGTVTQEEYDATGTVLTARVPKKLARELDAFRVADGERDDLDVDGAATS